MFSSLETGYVYLTSSPHEYFGLCVVGPCCVVFDSDEKFVSTVLVLVDSSVSKFLLGSEVENVVDSLVCVICEVEIVGGSVAVVVVVVEVVLVVEVVVVVDVVVVEVVDVLVVVLVVDVVEEIVLADFELVEYSGSMLDMTVVVFLFGAVEVRFVLVGLVSDLAGVVNRTVLFTVGRPVTVRRGSVENCGSLVVSTRLAIRSTPGTKISLLKIG